MTLDLLDRIVRRLTFLGPLGELLNKWLAQLGAASGAGAGPAKDLLNGTWLGHPLHPALTNLPIGAWGSAAVLDLLDGGAGEGLGKGADLLLALGCLAGAAAAATGLADWQDQYGKQRDLGTAHGLVNTVALGLCSTSMLLRWKGARRPAVRFSLAGASMAGLGAYIGGDMVFREGMQVNRNAFNSGPKKWTAVADEGEVVDDAFVRKQAGNNQVLLRRFEGQVCAVGAVCSHAGGPLDELPLEDGQLHCPWHGSHFDLRSGRVTHGPATTPNPVFETRVNQGKVEIRRP
ncbi:MAG: Rieske 2Fe-2S domain-containing protein [Candidatus Dormibacteria bacterium]